MTCFEAWIVEYSFDRSPLYLTQAVENTKIHVGKEAYWDTPVSRRRWQCSFSGVADNAWGQEPKGLRKVSGLCRSSPWSWARTSTTNGGHSKRRNLRIAFHLGVNYRILYGFVGKDVVLVSHGITKEKKVPSKEIDLAAQRLAKYRSDPDKYAADDELEEE